MADKKPEAKKDGDRKLEKKPEEEGSSYGPIILLLIFIFFLSVFIPYLAKVFGIAGSGNGNSNVFDPEFIDSLRFLGVSLLSSLQALSVFVSLIFVIGIIYAKFRLGQVKREMKLKMNVQEITEQKSQKTEETENKKWKRVVEHVTSDNPSDWRLSILEADILLGEVLEKAGYRGESIGEKLKTAERSDFGTIDQAWEAHKMRNTIAHEGSSYPLNQGEAKRIISLFEEVFREFYYI